MNKIRFLLVGVILTVAALGTSVVAQSQPAAPLLDVFATPATAQDRLPERVMKSGFAYALADTDKARRVASVAGANYYLVPGTDDRVCVVDVAEDSAGAACFPIASVRAGEAWTSTVRDGKRIVAVPMADGYDSARLVQGTAAGTGTRRVRDNFAAVVLENGGRVALSGPGADAAQLSIPSLPRGILRR